MTALASRTPGAARQARRARDVMVACPTTLAAQASVDEVRALLADDHVHMVLLTDGDVLVGTVVRGDVPHAVAGAAPALRWSTLTGRTVSPRVPADTVRTLLVRGGTRRLAVVDDDGTLLGLLCLKRTGAGFCSDADVASRARERADACRQV